MIVCDKEIMSPGNAGRRFTVEDAAYTFTAPPSAAPNITTISDIHGNIVQYVGKEELQLS